MSEQDFSSKPNPNTDSYIFINENSTPQLAPDFSDFKNVSGSFYDSFSSQGITSRISRAKDWVTKTSSKLRPWTEFFGFNKISKPRNVTVLLSRVYKNVFYFQNNYVFLFLGLLAYCLFTNPLLLVLLGAWCLVWWLVNYKSVDGDIKCAGHILGVKEIVGISFFASLPILYLAGVGSMFFWLIGVTMVIVGTHASLLEIEETENIPMDEISNEV